MDTDVAAVYPNSLPKRGTGSKLADQVGPKGSRIMLLPGQTLVVVCILNEHSGKP